MSSARFESSYSLWYCQWSLGASETDHTSEPGDKNPFSGVVDPPWVVLGTAKSKRMQLLSLVMIPTSPTFRISHSNPDDAEKEEIGIAAAVVVNG